MPGTGDTGAALGNRGARHHAGDGAREEGLRGKRARGDIIGYGQDNRVGRFGVAHIRLAHGIRQDAAIRVEHEARAHGRAWLHECVAGGDELHHGPPVDADLLAA